MRSETDVLRVPSRAIRERPQGTARLLGRASLGALVTTCVSGVVLSSVFPAVTPTGVSLAFGLLMLGTLALTALTALAQVWCWVAPARRGWITVDSVGVHVARGGRVRTIPRERVRSGWTVNDDGQNRVELRLRGDNVLSTTVESEAEADAVLDAAGVAPERRALTLPLGGPLVNVGIALASIVPTSCASAMLVSTLSRFLPPSASAAMGFLLFALVAAGMPLALRLFAPPSVQVGRDGVSVHGGLRQWFVSFSDLQSARATTAAISLTLRDERTLSIPTFGTRAALRDALLERIVAGISQRDPSTDLSARLAVLDRNSRSLEAWAEALRAVLSDDDYRHAGLSRDELRAVLDDPDAPPERRIAATFALAHSDKDRTVERVRVVVAATAHAPVRVALERAAEGTLDEASLTAITEERVRVA
ncbi:MAG: hypothetical protein Q8Q09_26335 [Deltaproteobacteria bacterium]|nr:hypothetical protein [Deltaproteobacteria bacterium]